MKKFFASILVAMLMAAGLVATTGGSAQAACPYTGCIATNTKVNAPNDDVARHNFARIRVRVKAPGSNAEPTGQIKVVVRRKADGEVYYRERKAYEGGKLVFITPKLHKLGKYFVVARFRPPANSVFTRSTGTDSFRVVRQP